MRIGNFEIICVTCGSGEVDVCNYHNNEWDEGVRLICKRCGEKFEMGI